MGDGSRELVIDGALYRWTRSHTHVEADGARRCVERLSAWREGHRRAGLTVRFIDGAGGHTTAGEGWGGHDGGLLVGSIAYNLHRPALAAAIIRRALVEGWAPASGRCVVIDDGFGLLRRIGPVGGRGPVQDRASLDRTKR